MNYNSALRHWTMAFLGSVLIVFAGLFFNGVTGKTQRTEKLDEQALLPGRLAFVRSRFGMSTFDRTVLTSNPDGTNVTTVHGPLNEAPREPAWSPDGTRIAFTMRSESTNDIFVANATGGGATNLTNTTAADEQNSSWSATGKIAYERGGVIWTMNSDGSGQAVFSAITHANANYPAWSNDGTKLAFVTAGEIWVINADGSNQRRVTNNSSTDTNPTWSPDGLKIMFAKAGSGISIINEDGTSETPVTSGTADTEPAWSSDGTKVAFRRGSPNAGLYTMNHDGTSQVRIFADSILFPLPCCDVSYGNPAWQPIQQAPNTVLISGGVTHGSSPVGGATVNLTGTVNAAVTTDANGDYQFSNLPSGGNYKVSVSFARHYFTPPSRSFSNVTSNQVGNFEVLAVCQGGRCARNGKIAFGRGGEIFTVNANDTNEVNITNNPATDGEPNWSPDGASIVFSTSRDGNFEIYRMNADGGSPTRLTNNAAEDFSPYYSPDGSTIAFLTRRDGNFEIYKMNADGSNQVRLTNAAGNRSSPAFSPDGKTIVFISASDQEPIRLWVMNADGSNPHQLSTLGGIQPVFERPSYSPDGSKIILTYTPDLITFPRNNWTLNANGTGAVRFPADGRLGSYSPDGSKIVFSCCQFDNSNRLRTVNIDGSSLKVFAGSMSEADWQGFAVRRAGFDFDGDGRSDPSIFRPSAGDWWYRSSINSAQHAVHWGTSSDVLTPADYDADLKTDFAVWRPSDGNFYILNSFDSTVRVENFGLAGDVPTGGDWDADGRADLAVYREGSQSVFYYRGTMGNPQGAVTFIPWGFGGDKPVAGDYDGDGRTDAAIFRPKNGTWYVYQSSNGQLAATNWGLSGDTLVPADYDGDGKTDPAVYRSGVWYLFQSRDGFSAFPFGIASDIPAPADYDGDGRADAAVYRNGLWWILNSQSGGVDTVQFGVGTDKPVPSAFVR